MYGYVLNRHRQAEADIGICRDSIEQIERRRDAIRCGRGQSGYEVRQAHVNRFIDGHEWLLLLDHDMVYAPDTLVAAAESHAIRIRLLLATALPAHDPRVVPSVGWPCHRFLENA